MRFPVLCLLAFGFAGYMTYYDRATGIDTLANPSIPIAVSLPLRIIKLFEGVFYVFAPIPMFAVASWGPALALMGYAACWIVIARSLQPIRRDDLWVPAMAVAMCIPFMFASEVRVTGEAAVDDISGRRMRHLARVAALQKNRGCGYPHAESHRDCTELWRVRITATRHPRNMGFRQIRHSLSMRTAHGAKTFGDGSSVHLA